MYEQYSVMLASLIIGTSIGFLLASIITAQMYLFVELPFKLDFPFALLAWMVILSLVTTHKAV